MRRNQLARAHRAALLLRASFRKRLTVVMTGTDEGERGDVPGWVMITLMSAVLVAALLALAGPALEDLFRSAINQVKQ